MTMQSPASCLWFGTGAMTKTLWPHLFSERLEVRAFVDEREKARGGTYQGCPVINLADVRHWEFDAFLLGARVSEETTARIVAAGVPREKIVSLDVERLLQETAADTGAVTFEECARLLSGRYGTMSRLIDLERLCRSNWLWWHRNDWRIAQRVLCTDQRTGEVISEIFLGIGPPLIKPARAQRVFS